MKIEEINIKVESVNELENVAKELILFFEDFKIVLFHAEMGVGKTTLIKQICKALKSIDKLSSPTYALVNEYSYPLGKIYHFDLYRILNVEELFDLGIEEYLGSKQFCFIEWPEKMIDIIDSKYVKIEIFLEENIRYIRATKILI